MVERKRRVRIGVTSFAITAQVEQNLAQILDSIARAKGLGVQIVCFPEYCLNPAIDQWVDLTMAISEIQVACRQHEIWAIFGAESGIEQRRQNSTYLIDPTGAIRYRYDKVHLWQAEKELFHPGTMTQVIDIGLCRLGIICCWDMAFPIFVSGLAQQGAELIVCPSYLCDYEQDQAALRAIPLVRAFENCVYFVLCDAFTDITLSESMICHPLSIRQQIARTEGLLVGDLDLDELAELKKYYGYST